MQINDQFWGGEEQTTTSSNGTKWTSYTLKDALNQENNPGWELPFNEEWDTSICPWAINPEADFMKIGYSSIYRDANNVTHVASAALLEEESSGIPIWFGMNANIENSGSNFKWGARNAFSQAYIQNTYNTHSNQYAMRSFDYSKLVYLIQVKVAQYQMEGADRYDYCRGNVYNLASYIANYETLKSNPIIQIYMIPYYWTGNVEYPNQRNVIDLNINTLGRFKTIDKAFTDAGIDLGGSLSAETCYTNDYLDYFMSVMGGYTNGTSTPSSAGIGFQPDGELIARNRLNLLNPNNAQWFRSFADAFNYNYTIGTLDSNTFNWPCRIIDSDMWDLTVDSNYAAYGYGVVRPELKVNEKFANAAEAEAYLLKQAAYLGTWFVTDSSALQAEPGSSDAWYLGEIDENGVTTGNYRQGAATAELPNSEWENPWDSSGWNGRSEDPTPWDSSQTTELTSISYDPAYGSDEYIVSSWALYEICRVLNYFKVLENEDFPLTGEIYRGICERLFGSTDPLESILSVVVYPLDIRTDFVSDTTEQVLDTTVIGNEFRIAYAQIPVVYDNSAAAAGSIRLSNAAEISRINWLLSGAIYGEAEIPYYANYKSFLDYEPYSSAELYIPFCGSVKLDPEIYIGHQIKVKYVLSPTDGTVKAYIMRDNLVIDTLTGNMGAAVTLYTSDEVARANNVKLMEATLQSQKQNKLKQAASFFTGAAGTLAGTGNGGAAAAGIVSGLVSTVFNTSQNQLAADQTQIRIDTAETPFKQLQSGGGYLSLIDELAVRLVVYRPEPLPGYSYDNWRDYGHTTGFACLVTGRLSEFSGYTECNNVITDGIPCTATEKKMIIEALQSGVYL